MSLPLQAGIPGAAELAVIALVLFFFLALPMVAVLVIVLVLHRRTPSRERIDRLEAEVADLREELDVEDATDASKPDEDPK